jgi:hypothetical protein
MTKSLFFNGLTPPAIPELIITLHWNSLINYVAAIAEFTLPTPHKDKTTSWLLILPS